VPLLHDAGHEAIAVDLPGDDERAGLSEYAELVRDAMGNRDDVMLVAQSLGGFTAALVADGANGIAFVNAMIPRPGETAGDWWKNTEHVFPADFTVEKYFLHDVPPDVAKEGAPFQREEAKIIFGQPCRFERWPDVPTKVIVGKDDRFFPRDFQARVAKERLGLDVEEIPGGHLLALSNPRGLATELLEYARTSRRQRS